MNNFEVDYADGLSMLQNTYCEMICQLNYAICILNGEYLLGNDLSVTGREIIIHIADLFSIPVAEAEGYFFNMEGLVYTAITLSHVNAYLISELMEESFDSMDETNRFEALSVLLGTFDRWFEDEPELLDIARGVGNDSE